MSVKIRLACRGRKKMVMYDLVVADARAPRDGRFIEKIGTYNPNTDPASIHLDTDKAFDWIMKGAQPTDTIRAILSYKGVMMKKHLQIGVNKGVVTQEEADKKLEKWLSDKETKIQGKIDILAKDKATRTKAKLEAETKVKEARVESLKKKAEVETAALVEEIKERGVESDDDMTKDVAEVEEASAVETAKASEAETPPEKPAKEVALAGKSAEEPKAEATEEEKKE